MEDPEVPTEHLHEEMHHHAAKKSWTMGVAFEFRPAGGHGRHLRPSGRPSFLTKP